MANLQQKSPLPAISPEEYFDQLDLYTKVERTDPQNIVGRSMEYNLQIFVNGKCLTHFNIPDSRAIITSRIVPKESKPPGVPRFFMHVSEVSDYRMFVEDIYLQNMQLSKQNANICASRMWSTSTQKDEYRWLAEQFKDQIRRRGFAVDRKPYHSLNASSRTELYRLLSELGY